ncbi:putative ankyrin repeat protein RF_0381 [Ptychodera flava]|uniref:putative ankyrin repeat protein RF_0381 n=1 Tax=Ptychodera flava TaxID=63121 RepID=UPI00396AA80C
MTSSASASTDIQVSGDQSAEDNTEHRARQTDESSEIDDSNGEQEEEMRMDESLKENNGDGDGDVKGDDGSEDAEDGDGSGDDKSDRDNEEEHMDTDMDTDDTITDGKDSSSDEESDEVYKRYRISWWGREKEPGHDTPLHNSAENGHLDIVEKLLNSGMDVNAKGKYERTALHLAAKKAHSAVISLLIDKGADVNAEDLYKRTVLHFASKKAPREVISLLIDKDADVNAEDFLLQTPLHIAVKGNNTNAVKYLIEQNADVDKRQKDLSYRDDWGGWSPLYIAVRNGFMDLVDLMVSKTADIDMGFHGTREEDYDGYWRLTCLGYAVKSGNHDMAKCLLEKGANVNYGGEWSPLYIAVREAKFDLVPLLLSHNAEVDALSEDRGYYCECTSYMYGDCEYIQQAPIHIAVMENKIDVTRLLIEHGSDVNLSRSCANGHAKVGTRVHERPASHKL